MTRSRITAIAWLVALCAVSAFGIRGLYARPVPYPVTGACVLAVVVLAGIFLAFEDWFEAKERENATPERVEEAMTAKSAVWIVEYEYNRDGDWGPLWNKKPNRTRALACEAMREGIDLEAEACQGFRYRVRRYIRQEPKRKVQRIMAANIDQGETK